jgi:hypothetical protein
VSSIQRKLDSNSTFLTNVRGLHTIPGTRCLFCSLSWTFKKSFLIFTLDEMGTKMGRVESRASGQARAKRREELREAQAEGGQTRQLVYTK